MSRLGLSVQAGFGWGLVEVRAVRRRRRLGGRGRGDDEVVEFGSSLVSAPGAVAFLSAESLPVCGAPTWWLVTHWELFQLVPYGGFFCGRIYPPTELSE